MVSKEVAETVIALISNESEQLSKITQVFNSDCNSVDQISVLTSLSSLLLDGVLEPAQQIIVVWLIYKSFENVQLKDNPFSDVLTFILNTGSSASISFTPKLGDMVSCILSSGDIEDLADHSANEILDPNFTIESSTTPDLVNVSMPPLQRTSPIIISKSDSKASQYTQHQILRELLIDQSLWTDFEMPFLRTIPEIAPISQAELEFSTITSIGNLPFIFDEEQGLNKKAAAKSLINESKSKPLKPWQARCVMSELDKSKDILTGMKFSKDDAEKMIGLNPEIGAVMIAELGKTDPKLIDKFTDGDVNEAKCEVAYQVIISQKSPTEFTDRFIQKACKNLTNTKDFNMYRHKALILCHLIDRLSKKNLKFSSTSLIELQSLQVELSGKSIKEADVLMKLFD